MADIVTRAGKGSPLTFAEVDANFTNLNNAKLELSGGNAGATVVTATGSTTARSLANRAADVVNVKDFGAVGDGVVDDTAAFTAAAVLGGLTLIDIPSVSYSFAAPFNPIGAAWLINPGTTWGQFSNGNFSIERGTRPAQTDGANIWRFTDRVFVGDAAARLTGDDSASDNNADRSWFGNTSSYAGYLGRNAKLAVSSSPVYSASIGGDIPYGIAVGMRGSDTLQEVIGVGATVVPSGSNNGWGVICELQNESSGQCIGIEIAAKNKAASNTNIYPNSQTTGVFGAWLAAGGDSAFGGSPTHPSTAGVVFVNGASTWNSGIVFLKDAITDGRAIEMSSEASGGAHRVNWYNLAGDNVFFLTSQASSATPYSIRHTNAGINFFRDTKSVFSVDASVSNINGLGVYGSASGNAVQLFAAGDDTNISISLVPKGSGKVGVGTTSPAASAALDVTSTIGGFLPPRMTGTQRDAIGSPANGLVLYNTTTDKLQVRAAGAWVDLH